jgi:hypothetical protein
MSRRHRTRPRTEPSNGIPSATRQLVEIVGEYTQIMREQNAERATLQAQLNAEHERLEIACALVAVRLGHDVDRARRLIDELHQQRHQAVAS